MVYQVDGHLNRAKALIEAGDMASLEYASLELRFALEKVAYQKLKLRIKSVPPDELRKWQPKKVIDTLEEMVDPHISQDAAYRFALEQGSEEDMKMRDLGTVKGVSSKEIGKHWQKMSSFLHAKFPKENQPFFDEFSVPSDAVKHLMATVDYIEALIASRFDAHFSETVDFDCYLCNGKIIRNQDKIKDGDIVKCSNSQCGALHIAGVDEDNYTFKAYQIAHKCSHCEEIGYIDAHKIVDMPHDQAVNYACDCGGKDQIYWMLARRPIPNAPTSSEDGGQ